MQEQLRNIIRTGSIVRLYQAFYDIHFEKNQEPKKLDSRKNLKVLAKLIWQNKHTVPIGYSDLGYSGRAAYSDLKPCDGPPSQHKLQLCL